MNELAKIERVEAVPAARNPVPVADLPSLGVAGKSLQQFIQSIKAPGGEGIYRVTFPKGFDGTLSRFKNEDAFLGSGISDGKMAQARLNQIHFDPTQMFMAFALMNIQNRLGNIEEIQREMLGLWHLEKEASLRAALECLNELVEDYKYNWQNSEFVSQQLSMLGGIVRDAKGIRAIYEKKIKDLLNTGDEAHGMATANKKVNELRQYIRYYHLAFYVHSYAVYLQTILRHNYDADNLRNISGRLQQEARQYNELIEKCLAWIDKYMKGSYNSLVAPMLNGVDSFFARATKKIPLGISKVYSADAERYVSPKKQKARLEQDIDSGTVVFADSVRHIDQLQNGQVVLYLEGEQLYITGEQEEE